ncbi:MAG: ATP-binding protein [Candidatus Dormibacteraceae bacterium]
MSAPDPWIRVTDRRIGAASAGEVQIFDRGYRGQPADERWRGSGLGLYLSRRATEEMGGSLVVETSPTRAGSAFRIGLPRGAA